MCARTKDMNEKKPKKEDKSSDSDGYDPFAYVEDRKDEAAEDVNIDELLENATTICSDESDSLSPVLPDQFCADPGENDPSYHSSQDKEADESSDTTEEDESFSREMRTIRNAENERKRVKREIKKLVNEYKKEKMVKYIKRQVKDIKKKNDMIRKLIVLVKTLENNWIIQNWAVV